MKRQAAYLSILKDFFRCGIAGWCLEILFTSVEAWMRGDVKMMGTTSVRHGLIYMVLIYTGEYIAGSFLMAKGLCPWDYSQWPDQIHGVIRLAFIPFWFGTGLLFESLCTH